MAGGGIGLVVASPVFYVVASFVTASRPAEADAALGRWVTEDGESSLALSPRNVAKFSNFPGLGTGKGMVRWSESGLEVGWPIKGYVPLVVERWPEAQPAGADPAQTQQSMVVNDVHLVRDPEERV